MDYAPKRFSRHTSSAHVQSSLELFVQVPVNDVIII